jgi:hypothetical protein
MVITLLIIEGLIYLPKAKQREDENEKKIISMFSYVAILLGISYTFVFINEFFYIGSLVNGTFYGDAYNTPPVWIFFNFLSVISGFIVFLSIYIIFESILRRTKYLLSILQVSAIILIVILFFTDLNLFEQIVWIILPVGLFSGPLVFLWIARKSSSEFQEMLAVFFIGDMMIILGYSIMLREIKVLGIFPLFIGPLITLIGTLLLGLPVYKPSFFTQKSKFSESIFKLLFAFLIIYTIIFLILGISVIAVPQAPILMAVNFFLQGIVNDIIIIYFLCLRKTKSKDIQEGSKKADSNLLAAFSKPQMLTEEEVSIAKEKQICLVCKNKLGGNIFLCSSCGAFYCFKCSDTLKNMENACWVCDAPFDKTKPVRLSETEKKLEVEVESNKKGDP